MGAKTTPPLLARAFDQLERHIPTLAARFAPYYFVAKWEWKVDANKQSHPGYIPTAEDIARVLRMLLDTVRESHNSTSSGGLCVWVEGDCVGASFQDDELIDPVGLAVVDFALAKAEAHGDVVAVEGR